MSDLEIKVRDVLLDLHARAKTAKEIADVTGRGDRETVIFHRAAQSSYEIAANQLEKALNDGP